jgi:hypothetical protein
MTRLSRWSRIGQVADDCQPRCVHCGDVIGVYEPVMLAVGEKIRRTSRAAEGRLPEDGIAWHEECFPLEELPS